MYRPRNVLAVFREEEEGGYGSRGGAGGIGLPPAAQPTAIPAVAHAAATPAASPSALPALSTAVEDLLHALTEERRRILDSAGLSAKEKLAFLDDNRKAIIVANGGTVRRTENVVYGLLLFGGVGLIVLALLTTFAGLPHEVTLAFVGTVLGGTIATIAQKLGNV